MSRSSSSAPGASRWQARGCSPTDSFCCWARCSCSRRPSRPGRSPPPCASQWNDARMNSNSTVRWFWFASPQTFFPLAGTIARWCAVGAALLALAGLYVGLVVAPTDAQQGEVYRIIFIHVPAAWISMFLYLVMASYGAMSLTFNTRLAAMMARAIAPTGAMFTFVALWTGAFWGRPTWGTYWVWDARVTSELVLLFLSFGFIALANAFEDPRRGDRAAALLALIGLVNLPIIYFSVLWWNTLHQGSSVSFKGTSMHVAMLTGMLLMAFSFWMYSIGTALVRVRAVILERERRSHWVRALAART